MNTFNYHLNFKQPFPPKKISQKTLQLILNKVFILTRYPVHVPDFTASIKVLFQQNVNFLMQFSLTLVSNDFWCSTTSDKRNAGSNEAQRMLVSVSPVTVPLFLEQKAFSQPRHWTPTATKLSQFQNNALRRAVAAAASTN
jgi:hypothetical protein